MASLATRSGGVVGDRERRAARAGRHYPNLVDNMRVAAEAKRTRRRKTRA